MLISRRSVLGKSFIIISLWFGLLIFLSPRILHTYAVSCGVKFTPKEKTKLKHFFDEQSTKAGGDANLAERWGTSIDELDALKRQIH